MVLRSESRQRSAQVVRETKSGAVSVSVSAASSASTRTLACGVRSGNAMRPMMRWPSSPQARASSVLTTQSAASSKSAKPCCPTGPLEAGDGADHADLG